MIKEISIISHVLNGDIDSFRFLVQKYQKPVISMINHITNDYHIAEDIAQDVFLVAYKKIPSFDPARSNFSTWLFTIARNKSLNALKKKKPLLLANIPEKTTSHNPHNELTQKEFFDQLDHALEKLPKAQKIAFILSEFENLSYAEIAQIEGVRLGTIKSRINRAKQKLQQALKEPPGAIK